MIFRRLVPKKKSYGEDSLSVSDGEENTSCIAVEEAVDLTSTRTRPEEEVINKDNEELASIANDEGDETNEPDNSEDEAEESASRKKPQIANQDDDEEGSFKKMRLCQDAENNNSFIEGSLPVGVLPPAGTSHVTLEALQNTKVAVAQFAATALAGGADSEAALQELATLQTTLYTLQHQQAFQLQLISQLQQRLTVNQPAGILSDKVNPSDDVPLDLKETSPSPIIQPRPLSVITSTPDSQSPSHHRASPLNSLTGQVTHHELSRPRSASPPVTSTTNMQIPSTTMSTIAGTQSSLSTSASLCTISSSLASSIITNNDPLPINEPNTLEMLQKRAQEVLDNASQGLLANNLADELAFRKGSRLSPYDSKNNNRSEPFFKHRCRYCGKVFGSDSALQIHIRSHTGERPFKCNVCGSRFTTKGNLKVHFQRHRDKFPHVKMNPNPVPEHLDKYHPPLLQQLAACGQRPLISPPPSSPSMPNTPHLIHSSSLGGPVISSSFHHPPGFLPPQLPIPINLGLHGGIPPLYRKPLINYREDQDVPENLSKPLSAASESPIPSPGTHSNSHHSFQDYYQAKLKQDHQPKDAPIKIEQEYFESPEPGRNTEDDDIMPKPEPNDNVNVLEVDNDDSGDSPKKYSSASPESAHQAVNLQSFEDCSLDSSKMSDKMNSEAQHNVEDEIDDQPENLSGRDDHVSMVRPSRAYSVASPTGSNDSGGSLQNSFANMLSSGVPSHSQIPAGQPPPPNASTPREKACTPPDGILDPARDPAIYSNLLPRPGSNDNSWESLIEITKTSETSKLQQLVDNIEHKLADPNQCIICQRVLSCKSALQMHYRTHTGERPFKCKICGRAFTTKGNLKTHMSVHRAKPPLRLLHQCTVCHKKFANSFVLQQHVNLHTNDPTELTPEQIRAAEIHDFSPTYQPHPLAAFLPGGLPSLHPSGFPLGFPLPTGSHALDLQSLDSDMDSKEILHQQKLHHQYQMQQHNYLEDQPDDTNDLDDDDDDNKDDDEKSEEHREKRSLGDGKGDGDEDLIVQDREDVMPSFSMSLAALTNQVRTITSTATEMSDNCSSKSPGTPLQFNGSEKTASPPCNTSAPLDLTPRAASSPSYVTTTPSISPVAQSSAVLASVGPNPFGLFSGILQSTTSSPSMSDNSMANVMSPASMGVGPLASLTSSAVRAATSTYNPLGLAVGNSAVRGNTTCNICYKTFACNSALEIHYRSHTKERPFKCTICDRGFSTKGNMKQHMLTHKIRDMPHNLFTDSNQPPPPSLASSSRPSSQPSHQSLTQHLHTLHQPHLYQKQRQSVTPVPIAMQQDHDVSRSPMCSEELNVPAPLLAPSSQVLQTTSADISAKKEIEAKKLSGMSSKHLCHVCNKTFSSSSALQIHMRTHTGDKPFQCSVCQKAFTTKGNLKVHMGTHMWTNGTSRRGRRMSLDIPSLPITHKDPEFLQRRPDLFYPYLPTPFLNGVSQKFEEFSDESALAASHSAGASKYAGLFGSIYGSFPVADKPSISEPASNGPHGMDIPKSLLFQNMGLPSAIPPRPSPTPSPSDATNAMALQNSTSLPHWEAAETLRQNRRQGGASSNSSRESPRLSASVGEGLAA